MSNTYTTLTKVHHLLCFIWFLQLYQVDNAIFIFFSFEGKETKAQRGSITYPGSHRKKVSRWKPKPGFLAPGPGLSTVMLFCPSLQFRNR